MEHQIGGVGLGSQIAEGTSTAGSMLGVFYASCSFS